jgi:hypothetical protein
MPNYLKGYTINHVKNGTIYFNKRKSQIKETELSGEIACVEFCKTQYNKLAVARITIEHKRYSCYTIKDFNKLVKGNKITGTVREWANRPGRTIKNIKIRGGIKNGSKKSKSRKIRSDSRRQENRRIQLAVKN